MKFFHDSYDVIVIGAAIAGLSCAIDLAEHGKKVLVLERHNLPGGICTSFIRDGIEMEATLHELYGIGEEDNPRFVREYFNRIGHPISWIKIPESYRFQDQNHTIDIPSNPQEAAKNLAKDFPGYEEKILEFYALCHRVSSSSAALQEGVPPFKEIKTEHADFFRTINLTFDEVLSSFGFPKELKEALSVYWIYLGTPPSIIPFTIVAIVIDEYINFPPFIPEKKSYEMGAKLAEYATSLGVQIEYGQQVEKILVKNKAAYGVRLSSGIEIYGKDIVSGPYPNTVYNYMIEPSSEAPKKAKKYVSSRRLNVSGFSLQILLDVPPEELNIHAYSTFFSPNPMDAERSYENMNTLFDHDFLVAACYNIANPDASPKGTTLLNLSVMPRIDAWNSVTMENYGKTKRTLAKCLIKMGEQCFETDLSSHIVDIIYETPVSFAHYAKCYQGAVYGYDHTMDDHLIARVLQQKKDFFIKHLYFAGAHNYSGDGEVPSFNNGKVASDAILRRKK